MERAAGREGGRGMSAKGMYVDPPRAREVGMGTSGGHGRGGVRDWEAGEENAIARAR